jgi:Ni,Fe-hydrogenase III large subunit
VQSRTAQALDAVRMNERLETIGAIEHEHLQTQLALYQVGPTARARGRHARI